MPVTLSASSASQDTNTLYSPRKASAEPDNSEEYQDDAAESKDDGAESKGSEYKDAENWTTEELYEAFIAKVGASQHSKEPFKAFMQKVLTYHKRPWGAWLLKLILPDSLHDVSLWVNHFTSIALEAHLNDESRIQAEVWATVGSRVTWEICKFVESLPWIVRWMFPSITNSPYYQCFKNMPQELRGAYTSQALFYFDLSTHTGDYQSKAFDIFKQFENQFKEIFPRPANLLGIFPNECFPGWQISWCFEALLAHCIRTTKAKTFSAFAKECIQSLDKLTTPYTPLPAGCKGILSTKVRSHYFSQGSNYHKLFEHFPDIMLAPGYMRTVLLFHEPNPNPKADFFGNRLNLMSLISPQEQLTTDELPSEKIKEFFDFLEKIAASQDHYYDQYYLEDFFSLFIHLLFKSKSPRHAVSCLIKEHQELIDLTQNHHKIPYSWLDLFATSKKLPRSCSNIENYLRTADPVKHHFLNDSFVTGVLSFQKESTDEALARSVDVFLNSIQEEIADLHPNLESFINQQKDYYSKKVALLDATDPIGFPPAYPLHALSEPYRDVEEKSQGLEVQRLTWGALFSKLTEELSSSSFSSPFEIYCYLNLLRGHQIHQRASGVSYLTDLVAYKGRLNVASFLPILKVLKQLESLDGVNGLSGALLIELNQHVTSPADPINLLFGMIRLDDKKLALFSEKFALLFSPEYFISFLCESLKQYPLDLPHNCVDLIKNKGFNVDVFETYQVKSDVAFNMTPFELLMLLRTIKSFCQGEREVGLSAAFIGAIACHKDPKAALITFAHDNNLSRLAPHYKILSDSNAREITTVAINMLTREKDFAQSQIDYLESLLPLGVDWMLRKIHNFYETMRQLSRLEKQSDICLTKGQTAWLHTAFPELPSNFGLLQRTLLLLNDFNAPQRNWFHYMPEMPKEEETQPYLDMLPKLLAFEEYRTKIRWEFRGEPTEEAIYQGLMWQRFDENDCYTLKLPTAQHASDTMITLLDVDSLPYMRMDVHNLDKGKRGQGNGFLLDAGKHDIYEIALYEHLKAKPYPAGLHFVFTNDPMVDDAPNQLKYYACIEEHQKKITALCDSVFFFTITWRLALSGTTPFPISIVDIILYYIQEQWRLKDPSQAATTVTTRLCKDETFFKAVQETHPEYLKRPELSGLSSKSDINRQEVILG